MKHIWFVKIACCLWLGAMGGAAHAQRMLPGDTLRLSLDSCLRYAFGHNASVRTAQLQRELAVRSLEAAKLRFLPSLSVQAGEDLMLSDGTVSASVSYGLSGTWILYGGWGNVNHYRKQLVNQRQREYAEEKIRNEVEAQLLAAYLGILSERDRIRCLEEQLRSARRQAEEAAEKARLGGMLESDRLLLEAGSRKLQCEVENARLNLETAAVKLRLLLGLPDRTPLSVTPVDSAMAEGLPSLEEAVRLALERLPDAKIAGLEKEGALYDLRCAKGNYAPSLSLGVYAAYWGGGQVRTDAAGILVTSGGLHTTLSLGLNVPVFSKGANRLQVAQSRIALQQAEWQEEQTRLEVAQAVEERYLALVQARNTFHADALMLQAAAASLKVFQAKFEAGSLSAADLVQQQERYLSAVNDYVRSKYAYILSQKLLQVYLGNAF
ncbi:MAG: TolC family protein [Bacteroidales bacterium]|nr:TolC family protein [Bacteroidales bacterium]